MKPLLVLAALLVALPVWGQQPGERPVIVCNGPPCYQPLTPGTYLIVDSPNRPPDDLRPCAFGLSKVEVIAKAKPTVPKPSIDAYVPIPNEPGGSATAEYRLFHPKPPTRMACPYEAAIAKYGDERVRYVAGEPIITGCTPGQFCIRGYQPSKVEVCDEDGKTNCVVVYTEPLK